MSISILHSKRSPVAHVFAGFVVYCILSLLEPVCADNIPRFSYRDRVTFGTNIADGIYDLRCSLFTSATNGDQVGASITNSTVAVKNGRCNAILDFSAGALLPTNLWLEIGVRTNNATTFATLPS